MTLASDQEATAATSAQTTADELALACPKTGRLEFVRRHASVLASVALCAWLGFHHLRGPTTGGDLSAAVARAHFVAAHPFTPVDLGWYAGTTQFGYSLVSQYALTLLGVQLTLMVILFGSLIFASTLDHLGSPRRVGAGLLATVGMYETVVAGRVAFGLGLVLTFIALRAHLGRRTECCAIACFAAGLTSPVAGVFVLIGASAHWLTGHRRAAVTPLLAALTATAVVSLTFGQGGTTR